MDYEPYDSSGTDDDLPPPLQNRVSRGGRISGNGRSAGMGSMVYPRMPEETNMEARIHQLEQEAYSSVLRAFKAQADAISWEKEDLITELRRELRLSNEEHRELLTRVNADETIRKIREWRQSAGLKQGLHGINQTVHDPVPSPSISVSRKKQKTVPSQSFGAPSPSFHPQAIAAPNQPSSSAGKRGHLMGPKGKKKKSVPPGASSVKMQHPIGPPGRGKLGQGVPSGSFAAERVQGAPLDPLIGRKVRTRWPDDNNFYEAVITDYNPVEGRHSLVYDIGTGSETVEWVNLSEISPNDLQWEGEDPGISCHKGYGVSETGTNRHIGRDHALGVGRGRGLSKSQSRKDFPPSQNGIGKSELENIQLLHTDTLIKEIEKVFSASHPDPMEMEKAKLVLKEHEQALTEAIARLTGLSEGEHDEDRSFTHPQTLDRD